MAMVMRRVDLPGDEILKISLWGLAIVYFLSAFRPPEIRDEPGTQKGFKELLYEVILPKVVGIGSAVSILGILFTLLGLPGAKQQMLIGFGTITGALVLLGIAFIQGNEGVKAQTSLLYRVLAIWVVCAYYLFRSGVPTF